MEYNEILDHLAPCGLSCSRCFAYGKGEIKDRSQRLLHLLGSFERYAENFSAFLPVFKNYPACKEMLEYFSGGDCTGCRSGSCKYPNCGVFLCYRKKGVDFCFQCDEFPCNKPDFDPDFRGRWIQMNRRMKEIGVESYFEETQVLPRYR